MANLTRKLILFLIGIFNFITITACWDNMDLTEKAFVTAVGIDKISENKIGLTLQIVKPTIIKAGEQGSSEKEEAVWVFSNTGDTIFEAAKNQMTTANRKPFYNHAELMVIGEEFARSGIKEALDFWERNHEPRMNANIIIAKGMTAKEILMAKSELEDIPSMHITDILENNEALAKIKKVTIIDVLKQLIQPGLNPVIGVIEVAKKEKIKKIKNFRVEGSAIFKKDKLIGWLNSIETRGLLFIQDEVKSGVINVPNPLDKNKKVAIEIARSSGKIDAKVKDGELVFLIQVKVVGNIADQQGNGDLTTQEILKKLEEEAEKVIEKEIWDVVKIAQKKYKSDFIGFSGVVYRKYLDYWKQVQDNWEDVFSNTPVEINVKVNIKRTGIIGKSFKIR